MKPTIRVSGYEFHFIDGPRPHLRMSSYAVDCGEQYIGSIQGLATIRRLRDYLIRALKEHAKRRTP